MSKTLETRLIPVERLKVNDLCDLTGDKYADDGTNAVVEYEYIPVVGLPKQETPDCVAVPFDFDVVGFPTGHQVKTRVAEVTFHPQAWQRDYAVEVDPEGDTSWFVQLADTLNEDGEELANDDFDSDDLRNHENAPQWVKDWSGPFYITIDRGE